MRISRVWAAGLVAAMAVPLGAHRLDELLLAARIGISTTRTEVTLDLTPGIEVAASVAAAVDTDGDRHVSAAEAGAYARTVASALGLQIDDQTVPLAARVWAVPAIDELGTGNAIIRIELAAEHPPIAAGQHVVRFRNAYRPDIGVYLANALVPTDRRISVVGQARDARQTELDVTIDVREPGVDYAAYLIPALAGLFVIGVMVWIRKTIG